VALGLLVGPPESVIVTPEPHAPVTVPEIVQFVVQLDVPGFTVMLRVPVVAVKPSESVTFTVKLNVPDVVGVALAIVPVVPRLNGLGSVPEASVKV
jgi:hypothetical protein